MPIGSNVDHQGVRWNGENADDVLGFVPTGTIAKNGKVLSIKDGGKDRTLLVGDVIVKDARSGEFWHWKLIRSGIGAGTYRMRPLTRQ